MNFLACVTLFLLPITIMATPHTSPNPKPIISAHGLDVHVYHLPPHPVTYQNSTSLSFSPTAFTLITSTHSAILIDAPATTAQGTALTSWIKSILTPHQTLTGIYITHGHGDHFFTSRQIRSALNPHAHIYAKPDTFEHMQQQYSEPFFSQFWATLFPNEIDPTPFKDSDVTLLPANGEFHLDAAKKISLHALEVGQADTYNSTILSIPALSLAITGDVVYGHCHQLLAETATPELRQAWLSSLDKVAALKPQYVIPSHMQPTEGYGNEHIAETKEYIRAYEELLPESKSWQELEGKMKKRFPERVGSFIFRWTMQTPFGAAF
jgi:glyoxylase-like metal-dependent hydrolase (beta-lactamase superfamily II)